ncbi:MAG TPA: RhuM family protein [Chitinophaga sp.]
MIYETLTIAGRRYANFIKICSLKIRTVRQEGKRNISRDLEHYNLDMLLSIGYRVNSVRGTQFRI